MGPEAKLIDGLLQAQDYIKTLNGVGGFAVLFPNELRKPMPKRVYDKVLAQAKIVAVATFAERDPRPPGKIEGSLDQVSEWVAQHVLQPLVAPREPDSDLTIRALREAVEYLQFGMAKLGEEQLELVFGGRSVFENILEFKPKEYPVTEMRRGATYLLVNQILFYHVLSKTKPDKYRVLDVESLAGPSQLQEYFKDVLRDDYTPIFGFDITQAISPDITDVLRRVVAAIKLLRPEKFQIDLLGKIFHDLIPYATRKVVAAFYTNNEAAELIAKLAIKDSNAQVIDLACGSGTLLVAAYHRKRALLQEHQALFGPDDHRKFLEQQITGVDIMPFAAHLAVVHLSLQAHFYHTEKVRVAVWDSTQLRPRMVIPAIAKELKEAEKQANLEAFSEGRTYEPAESAYVTKGVVTADAVGGEQLPLNKVDLVIMNPPFTRQERLPEDYKRLLDMRFGEYTSALHGQIGLYGYFILLAHRFAKDETGRVALVLPATVLRIQSAESIRRLVAEKFTLEYILTSWESLAFSEGAWFRDIVLIGRKNPVPLAERKDHACEIVTIRKPLESVEYALNLADGVLDHKAHDSHGVYLSDQIYCRKVTHQDLQDNLSNWFYYISVYDPRVQIFWENFLQFAGEKLESFSKQRLRRHGTIIRGIETKQAGYVTVQSAFVMRHEAAQRAGFSWQAKIEKRSEVVAENVESKKKVTIPKLSLVAALRSSSNLAKPLIGKVDTDYVMVEWDKDFFGYLGAVARNRVKEWKRYVSQRTGKLFIGRRFVVPAPGTVHLAYVSDEKISVPATMWVVNGFSDEENKILWLWLNSTLHLVQMLLNKIEDVWLNVHEYVLEEFLVPRTGELSAGIRKELVDLFDKLKDKEFPSLRDQVKSRFHARREIDLAIMKALGFSSTDARKELETLYELMDTEMDVLFRLMQEREPNE